MCDNCNIVFSPTAAADSETQEATSMFTVETATPKTLKKHLDEYVIQQDQAKRVLSVAVYNHYKRVRRNLENKAKTSEANDNEDIQHIFAPAMDETDLPSDEDDTVMHSRSVYVLTRVSPDVGIVRNRIERCVAQIQNGYCSRTH